MDIIITDSIKECLADSGDGTRKSLLTGNGFCRAHPECGGKFGYPNLLESAGLNENNQKFFGIFGTTNFEQCICGLENTKTIICTYDKSKNPLLGNIDTDIENLKQSFANAITHQHPARRIDLKVSHFSSAGSFLKNFRDIFTTNYDLMLYWTILSQKLTDSFGDGFTGHTSGTCRWDVSQSPQTVHFLHGALHLFYDGTEVLKITYNTSPLIDEIRAKIGQNLYPIIILEGNHKNKLNGIQQNPYLRFAYDSLLKLDGDLFVYGCSFEFDDHILEAINQSQIQRLYVSFFGGKDSNSDLFKRIHKHLEKRLKDKTISISFFPSETNPVWG